MNYFCISSFETSVNAVNVPVVMRIAVRQVLY